MARGGPWERQNPAKGTRCSVLAWSPLIPGGSRGQRWQHPRLSGMLRAPAPLSRQRLPVPERGASCHRHSHAATERLRGSGAPGTGADGGFPGWAGGGGMHPRQGGAGGVTARTPARPCGARRYFYRGRRLAWGQNRPPPHDPARGEPCPVSGAHPGGGTTGVPHGHGAHGSAPTPTLPVSPPRPPPVPKSLHHRSVRRGGAVPAPALPPADAHPPPTAPPLPGSAAHGPRRGSGGGGELPEPRSPLPAHGRPPPHGEGPTRGEAPPARGCGSFAGRGRNGAKRSPPPRSPGRTEPPVGVRVTRDTRATWVAGPGAGGSRYRWVPVLMGPGTDAGPRPRVRLRGVGGGGSEGRDLRAPHA